MSDIRGATIVFEKDIDEEAIDGIVNAILHIKGVLTVTTKPVESADWMATQRAQAEVRQKLLDVIRSMR